MKVRACLEQNTINSKRLMMILLIFAILSCKTTEDSNTVTTLDEIILKSAKELASITPEKTLGISDIYLLGTKQSSNFSIFLANKLSTKLFKLGFSIADRDHLKQLESEWKFQSSFSNEETTVEIAKLNGISAIIVGNYSIANNLVDVQLKLIDTQTGLLLGISEFSLPIHLVSQYLNDTPSELHEVTTPDTQNSKQKNPSMVKIRQKTENTPSQEPQVKNSFLPGHQSIFRIDEQLSFNLIYVPALSSIPEFYPYRNTKNYNAESTPIRKIENPKPVWIGETEVTIELWNLVTGWAVDNGYSFSVNKHRDTWLSRNPQFPVSIITWRDAMLFCNALTEYTNSTSISDSPLIPVYYTDPNFSNPIRRVDASKTIAFYPTNSPSGTQDDPYVDKDANGFRLPTIVEWTIASRYKGDFDKDGAITSPGEFYLDNVVSGSSTSDPDDKKQYAIAYERIKIFPVASKQPNGLGFYDISGNISEWCYNWTGNRNKGQYDAVGKWKYLMGLSNDSYGGIYKLNMLSQVFPDKPVPYYYSSTSGFRIARNVE
ncbi:MAG: FlgO family outer membrane protein [Spirochaetaceae bacterium]